MSSINIIDAFKEPSDPNITIWRYMDFTKYVSLIESGSLHFSRIDQFEDPYEGATSQANIRMRHSMYSSMGKVKVDEMFNRLSHLREQVREWTYASCWHMNDHESAAMWKLYSKTDESIAIVSKYSLLRDCIPAHIPIGRVEYLDYDEEHMPEGNLLHPFVYKRKSFKHEEELRAIIQLHPPAQQGTDGENRVAFGQHNPITNMRVSVDLSALIVEVRVSPTAPAWFAELVERVTKRYGLGVPVRSSSLRRDPIY